MKKAFLKINGISVISKKDQKIIKGGRDFEISDCPSGCFGLYFCQFDCAEGERCAVPSPSGQACFGTISSGQCCL